MDPVLSSPTVGNSEPSALAGTPHIDSIIRSGEVDVVARIVGSGFILYNSTISTISSCSLDPERN